MSEEVKAAININENISEEEKEKLIENHIAEATKNNVLAINYLKFKRKTPKTMELLKEWLASKTQLTMEEEILIGSLMYNPRGVLYDFLDENEIYLTVDHGVNNQWVSNLNNTNIHLSRVSAEIEGFEIALNRLETLSVGK
jgi:DNA helicase IV